MNYTELLNAIQVTTENYEASFVASIPTFVQQAEQSVFNSVHLLDLRRNITNNLTANNQYLRPPTDFLAVYSLAVIGDDGAYNYMINKDVNFIREAYPYPQAKGLPRHYAMFDDKTIILGPTPDKAYEVELHQFYYPPSIVTAGTSWLGDNFANVLFYGTLINASIFMKDDETLGMYKAQYTEALALLKRLGDGLERQDTYRSGQVIVPVT